MKQATTYLLALVEATALTLLGLGLLALCMLFPVKTLAAEPPSPADYRDMQKSVSVIGMEVKGQQGEYLGSVKDLALDLENGRVVEVIVSSGGFLGFGQRTVAVPPAAFTFDPALRLLRLNMDADKFRAAPGFSMSKWAEHCQSQHVAEAYRYFGQKPYFAADGQDSASGNTETEPLGYVQRNSKLLDLPVKNLQNELLGSVDSFTFNLLLGRNAITHVIVLSPGFIDTRSIIPARALRFNAAHDALVLDISAKAFEKEPHFEWFCGNKNQWPRGFRDVPLLDGNNSHFRMENYSNTKVATNNGVNTRQNVHEGAVTTYTPLAQGASFRDVDKTHRIYDAMRADASLSQNAQNVEVGTLNGQTTLRGHVNTDEGKRVIGEIAAKAGLPENVSNLLEVRTLPAAQ